MRRPPVESKREYTEQEVKHALMKVVAILLEEREKRKQREATQAPNGSR